MTDLQLLDICYNSADRLIFLSSLLRNRSHITSLGGISLDSFVVDLVEEQLVDIASALNAPNLRELREIRGVSDEE